MNDTSLLHLFPSQSAGRFGRRQKRARGNRLPVTIVSGFLGAGKTTLVRKFLETPEGEGTALVINEFGEVGIDDALLRESSDQVTLLGNGCLCCVTRSDLQVALRNLVADRDRNAIPHFKRVLIETSGLADLGPILQTFATDRALGGEFALETVLTLVDAVNGATNLNTMPEARKQAILADRLAISKADLSDSGAIEALQEHLAALNPRAPVTVADHGALDPRILTEPAESETRAGFVAEAQHADGVTSFVLRDETPWDWPTFQRAFDTLMALRGGDILRVKGLLSLDGSTGPVVFQAVQHLMHPPVELMRWPDEDRDTRIVFITRGVPEQAVRELFAACRTLGFKP